MICVLNDGRTWTDLDGCMVISLDPDNLEKLNNQRGFDNTIAIQEQWTLSSNDTYFEENNNA